MGASLLIIFNVRMPLKVAAMLLLFNHSFTIVSRR
jgi:hypothetical protein